MKKHFPTISQKELIIKLIIDEKMTLAKVAKLTGHARSAIYKWKKQYIENGIEGLKPKKRKARSYLSESKEKEFIERVIAGPTEKDGIANFTAKDLQKILKEEFGLIYTQRNSIYNLLKRLGLSWIKPREINPKTDIKLQEKFKKKSKNE